MTVPSNVEYIVHRAELDVRDAEDGAAMTQRQLDRALAHLAECRQRLAYWKGVQEATGEMPVETPA